MEVILKKNVDKLGYANEIVTVKPGYGRNFLIPQKFAVEASPSNLKQLEERLKHPSIPQMRAEYMPLSTYLLKFVLEQSNFNKIYQSEYALKEGVLAHYLN